MKLIFATNNNHKLQEVKAILGECAEIVSLSECGINEDIPETSETIAGNALQKARYVYEKTGRNCFADDTGLEVNALDGAPGVHSARYATDGHDFAANRELLLRNMEGKSNRKARFRTVIALIFDDKTYMFEGVVEGVITDCERGSGGFGYDSLFIPDGYDKTFAELAPEVKNSISHRARAVTALAEFLKSRL